jgi:hypothetical protein
MSKGRRRGEVSSEEGKDEKGRGGEGGLKGELEGEEEGGRRGGGTKER